jgi:hypothetical protein
MTLITGTNAEGEVTAEEPRPVTHILPAVASPTPSTPPVATQNDRARVPTVRDTLTRVISHARYHLARIGPAGQAGAAALLAAIIVALSAVIPARNAIEALSSDIVHAQQAPHTAAGSDYGITRVVASLPTREQIPAVLRKVFQEAQNAGVQLDSGHYAFSPAKAGGVARYEIQFPVKASYPQIRNFVNATLTAVPAAGLDKLHVERKAVADTVVHADVDFVIFVRGE